MGLKMKGGMWCASCQRPVAGQKSTAKVAKLGGALLTAGLYAPTPGSYHCPQCGSAVSPNRQSQEGRGGIGSNAALGVGAIAVAALVAGLIAGVAAIVHALEGPKTVPDVMNVKLDEAKRELRSAGLSYSYNREQGVFGILNESHWVVCGETPEPGSRTKHKVWLDVRHYSCGSSTTSSSTSAQSPAASPARTARTASPSQGVEERLAKAGYAVAESSHTAGNPPATAGLDITLPQGASVSIYFYKSAADAALAGRPFKPIERTNPKQFELRQEGARLYVGTVQEPAILPMRAFNKVVAAA